MDLISIPLGTYDARPTDSEPCRAGFKGKGGKDDVRVFLKKKNLLEINAWEGREADQDSGREADQDSSRVN